MVGQQIRGLFNYQQFGNHQKNPLVSVSSSFRVPGRARSWIHAAACQGQRPSQPSELPVIDAIADLNGWIYKSYSAFFTSPVFIKDGKFNRDKP